MPLTEDVIYKMAAFGLVAATALNFPIRAQFREYFGQQETSTFIATIRIGRAAARAKEMG